MSIQSYRDLEVWRRAMALVEGCYGETRGFPADERFGLVSQLRRAAVSIPANIAEGAGRSTTAAFINHLGIAQGSLAEVETCLEISMRLGYLTRPRAKPLVDGAVDIGRMLNGLIRSLRRKMDHRPLTTDH